MMIQHIYAEDDPHAHVISLTEPCWCEPKVQTEDSGQTIIHVPSIPMFSVERDEVMPVPLRLRDHPAYVGQATVTRRVKVPNLKIVTRVLQGTIISAVQLPTKVGHAA